MTKDIRSTRPARAAIAAVLAFSATPLLAQEAAPPAIAPIAPPQIAPVMDATTSAPAAGAPVMAPAQPVVQATPSVEERKAEAIAQAETARAEAVPVAARREQQRPLAREGGAKPTSTKTVVAATVRASAPVEIAPAEAMPVTPNVATSTAAEPATVVPPVNNGAVWADNSGEALTWGLAGGALLLIGAAGTMAMRRRRNRAGDLVYRAHERVASAGIVPAPEAALARQSVEPAFTPVAPATTAAASDTARTAEVPSGSLAAIVDAPPSRENPFLTRSNRLRRAHFLLARQAGTATGGKTGAAATAASQAAPIERPQIVYSFGKDGARRNGLIPRTG